MDEIVVLGGYGEVGSVTARRLAAWFPGRVVIAGRDQAKAEALARPIGAAAAAVDVADDRALAGLLGRASVVVMAVERNNEAVAHACLERGVHFVELSATGSVLDAIERHHELAERSGATAALSVGLAPGVTNLLARAAVGRLPGASTVDINILIGLGERHGTDAVRWTVRSLAAAPGGKAATATLPEFGSRTLFPFPFADQHAIARTLRVRATTRLGFDSAAATRAVFALRVGRVFRLVETLRLTEPVARLLVAFPFGGTRFAVHAMASDGTGKHAETAVTGDEQSLATGLVAAHTARLLATGGAPAGVHHLDQLVDPDEFLAALAPDGIVRHERRSASLRV